MMVRTLFCAARRGKLKQSFLKKAVAALKKGGLVVFPTETVYGLAVDPRKRRALESLRRLKGRDAGKALTLQVPDVAQAKKLVKPNALFEHCAKTYWPGPLTLVAKKAGGPGKIGLRIPRHEIALSVLRAYGKPLAVTSVNRSGEPSIGDAAALRRFLDGKVDIVILDRVRPALASTVVDVSAGRVEVIREGPIRPSDIENGLSGAGPQR